MVKKKKKKKRCRRKVEEVFTREKKTNKNVFGRKGEQEVKKK